MLENQEQQNEVVDNIVEKENKMATKTIILEEPVTKNRRSTNPNLIPNSPFLTPEEKKAKCLKGAYSSHAVRRVYKKLRQIAGMKGNELLPDGKTYNEAIIEAIRNKALQGDLKAAREFFKLQGMAPTQFEQSHTEEEIEEIQATPIDPQILAECKKMGFGEAYLKNLRINHVQRYIQIIAMAYGVLGKNINQNKQEFRIHIDGLEERLKN